MDVKELVEGYCQVTGRPTFTITVDEYIKFHQVALFNAPKSTIDVGVVPSKVEENKVETKTLDNASKQSKKVVVKNEVPIKKDDGPFTKASDVLKEDSSIKKEEVVVGKVEEVSVPKVKEEKPKNNNQVALDLLKSIQG